VVIVDADHKPHGAGRSSFDLIDEKVLFNVLPLKPDITVADIGCGKGDYTIRVAKIIGPKGKVYGIDAWQDSLNELSQRAKNYGLTNIETLSGDANIKIPLNDKCTDTVLMTTVFHDLLRNSSGDVALGEIVRILKPGGKLAILEFKKIPDSPGPPLDIRLSPEEVEKKLLPFGLIKEALFDIGPYLYLITAVNTALS
jgi:ubiquinone/menaquinone biosynthesis C-methylase UbiE